MTGPRTPLHVVPGGTRKRYTRRQKVTAVIAAEMSTQVAASEQLGIPRKTIAYWADDPDFAIYRQKAREELGPEGIALAHNVLAEIKRRLPEFEPRDLSTLLGILVDKAQLVTGQATSRTETKDITAALEDHEKEALADAIDDWLKERTPA